MIATLACTLAFADKLIVGQKWHYLVTWHFTAKDIDLTDEESFDVEVSKVLADSTTLKVSQKLTASIVDNNRIPTDPKAVPAVHEWALTPNGSVAFQPLARFPLEQRVYRILKGVLPAPKGDEPRDETWKLEYPDDGLGMPQSRLKAWLVKPGRATKEFGLIYQEKVGTNGTGRFIRTEKFPLPTLLEVKFLNTRMQGGTDIVDCDFTMTLKADK
jgi:hypothetical protein